MSFADIWDSVKETGKSLGTAALTLSGAGILYDLAHATFDDDEETFGDFVNGIGRQGTRVLDPLLNPETLTGAAVGKVGEYWDAAYAEVSEHWVATDTVLKGTTEGHNPFSRETWSKAYEIAQNRSIGQSHMVGGREGESVFDPQAYKKLHNEYGAWATVGSGTVDFAANFFLDPTIVVGKGVKVARAGTKLRKITDKDQAAGIGNLMETEASRRVFGFESKKAGLKTRTESVVGTADRPGFVDGKNAAQIRTGLPELTRSPQGSQIAGLLADTNKILNPADRVNARKRILRVAYGDEAAIGGLKQELAHIDDQLANLQTGETLRLERAMIADSEPALFYAGTEGGRVRYFDSPEVLADAERQLANRAEAVTQLNKVRDELKPILDLQHSAKTATLTTSRAGDRALRRAEGDTLLRKFAQQEAIETVHQWGLAAKPMRIVKKLAVPIPRAYVRAGLGVADALKTSRLQGIVNLHDVDGTSSQLDSMMYRAKLAPKERMALQSEFTLARTEAERMRVIARVESASVRSLAKKYAGVDLDSQKAVENFVGELTARGRMRRESMTAALNGRAYSATRLKKDVEAAGGEEPTLRIDQIDDDGIPVSLPVLETQGANIVPLMDVDHAEKMLKRQGSRMTKMAKAWQAERFELDRLSQQKAAGGFVLESALEARRKAADFLVATGEELTRIWKFSVLFRLGYPLRILSDDHMRIWAKIGAMSMYHPMTEEGIKNFGYNQVRRRGAARARRIGLQGRVRTLDDVIGDEQDVKRFRETKSEIKSIDRRLSKIEGGADESIGFMDPNDLTDARSPALASDIIERAEDADVESMEMLHESMTARGFDADKPITVMVTPDGQYGVSDGNHRLQAALELGIDRVPVRIVKGDSPQEWWREADPEKAAAALARIGDRQGSPEMIGLPVKRSEEADKLRARRDALQRMLGEEDLDDLIRERDQLVALFDNKAAWQGELPEDLARKAGVDPKGIGKRRMGEGQITIAGNHTIDDAFAGPYGHAVRKMVSSDETFEMNLLDSEARLYKSSSASGSWKEIAGDEPGHLDAWEWAINKQLRQSQVARKFIEGASVEDVTRWLGSSEGRALRKRIPWHTADPEDYAHRVKAMVDQYVPEGSIREAAAKRNIRKGDLEAWRGDDLNKAPAVHGAGIDANIGALSGISGAVNNAMSRVYRYISEVPSDKLARHPFFMAMYRQEARDLGNAKFAAAKAQGRKTLTGEELDEVQRVARERARAELKRTLFDMSAHSNAAHMMRFLSPFFSAHQESLVRWYRLAADDPSIPRRFTQGFEAIRAATPVIDENGEPVKPGAPISGDHQIVLPKAIVKLMGFPPDEQVTVNENSFNIVLQGGITNPGFGPLAQLPVEWAAKKWADKKDIVKLAETMNPIRPDSSADIVFPATVRRVWAAVQGEKSGEFAYYYSRTIADEVAQFQMDKGRMPNRREFARIEKDAKTRTSAIAWLRVGQNSLSPFPGTPQGRFAVQRDAWHRLQDEARARGGKQGDYEWAERVFVDKYGPAMFPLMQSTSNNPAGMDATAQTVGAIKRHRPLLDVLPARLHKMVVGPEAAGGEYNGNAANWLRGQQIKPGDPDTYYSSDTPGEAGLEGMVAKGWRDYNKLMSGLNAQAFGMGLTSYQDSAQLRELKSQAVQVLAERNFAWWDDYSDFDPNEYETWIAGMQEIASSKRLLNDTARNDVHVLKQYLNTRQQFTQQLEIRRAMGGSASMEAQSNADLAAMYQASVSQMVESNTFFEQHMFSGVIERDPYLVAPPVAA